MSYLQKSCASILSALTLGLGFTLALSIIFEVEAQSGSVRYVARDGTDYSNNCASQNTPCATVQHAVDMATPNDEIRVAAGSYANVSVRHGITQVVYVDKSLTLRGGYTPTNWSTPDPANQPTLLDAQQQGRVLVITGAIIATVEGFGVTGGNHTDQICGGICVVSAAVQVRYNTIFSNTGGGVFVVYGNTTLNNNAIYSNTAEYGGGVYVTSGGQAILRNNTLRHNRATRSGGGIASDYVGILHLENNHISHNTADESGGGLYLYYQSRASLTNTIIADNQAGGQGSGVYVAGASADLKHTTIARNRGGNGSGLHVTGSVTPAVVPGTVALTNTILVSHTTGITAAADGSATLEATLWGSDNWANVLDWGGAGTIATGTTNIWGDPLFAAPDAGNYHLRFGSAALDQGVNAGVITDIDSESRPYNGSYDLGADEGQPGLSVTKAATSIKADGRLTYTLYVTNTDFITLTATITDILPGHVTPTGIVSWPPALIAPGGVWTQPVVVTVETGYIGSLVNKVQVSSVEGASGVYTHSLSVGRVYYLPLIFKEG